MLFIQHNLLAENANRQLKISTGKNTKTTEKLSSGYKINRAADDAAGLSISEKMRRQVRGLHQTVDNISEGVGYVQTAEGALNEVHDMLQRINELAVKAANGTNTVEDRAYIDSEIQHLKNEMNRIFSETTFNERKIWEPRDKRLLGYEQRQAVSFTGYSWDSIPSSVTNENCGVLARSGYHITADEAQGIQIGWKGWDGNGYNTEWVSWDTLKENNYTFEMSQYFGEKNVNNPLYYTDANGEFVPKFTHKVSFTVEELATIPDIVACVNDTTMSSESDVWMNAAFQKADDGSKISTNGIGVSASLKFSAAYASFEGGKGQGHNFNVADDLFLEPNLVANGGKSNLVKFPSATKLSDAINSTESWAFSFKMKGIAEGGGEKIIDGTLYSIDYYSYDGTVSDNQLQPDDEDIWWYKVWNSYYHEYHYYTRYHQPTKNLGGVMSALTGTKDEYDKGSGTDKTPGLLKENKEADATDEAKAKAGATDMGGVINLYFDLTLPKGEDYKYGIDKVSGGSSVGSFVISMLILMTRRIVFSRI